MLVPCTSASWAAEQRPECPVLDPDQGIGKLLRVFDGRVLLDRNQLCRVPQEVSDKFQTHLASRRRMNPDCSSETRGRPANTKWRIGS